MNQYLKWISSRKGKIVFYIYEIVFYIYINYIYLRAPQTKQNFVILKC